MTPSQPPQDNRRAELEAILKAVINRETGTYAHYIGELSIDDAVDQLTALLRQAEREAGDKILDNIYKIIPVTFRGNSSYQERTADEWREVVASIAAHVQDYDHALVALQVGESK